MVGVAHWEAPCSKEDDPRFCEGHPYYPAMGGRAGAIERARRAAKVPKFLTGECDLGTRVAAGWLREVAGHAKAAVYKPKKKRVWV